MTQRQLNRWTKDTMSKLTLDKLETFLWSAADLLRGSINILFLGINLSSHFLNPQLTIREHFS